MRLRSTLFAAVAAALASSGASAQPTTVTVTTPVVANTAGYRLLAAPVADQTVANLASQNLVQGISDEYPTAPGPNIFTFYDNAAGGGGAAAAQFRAPGSKESSLRLGAGFFWYFYDQNIPADPGGSFGGGTSSSNELTNFTLTATGTAATSNVSTRFTSNPDGAYMMGNPFAQPFTLSGVSASSGTLDNVFQTFDPSIGSTGSYVPLSSTSIVAPWQGFFGTVVGAPAGQLLFVNYAYASVAPGASPTFYGRAVAESGVKFRLDGATAAGTTGDVAAWVRFLDGALAGQDRYETLKLSPPGGPYALLAPVGERDGAPARLAVNSLPGSPAEAVSVPLSFTATHDGSYTISWESTLGAARSAVLVDRIENRRVDLASATSYAFTSAASDWTDRFVLEVAGRSTAAGEEVVAAAHVGTFAPNPATGTSRLAITVDAAQDVRAVVLDALGRQVAVAFDGSLAAGASATAMIDTARLAPGIYVVRVVGETFTEARRLTVVR